MSEKLRKVITDAQDILARYIVPDSGITEHECVNQLLGLLDGPQAREALAVVSANSLTEGDLATQRAISDKIAPITGEITGNRAKREEPSMLGPECVLGPSSDSQDGGKAAHTDHPLRHWDRTCPACIEGATWIEQELKDGDRICEAAGVQRTECGWLPVQKIINAIKGRRVPPHRSGGASTPEPEAPLPNYAANWSSSAQPTSGPSELEVLRMALGNTAACLGDALATYNRVVGQEVFKNAETPAAPSCNAPT